MSLMSGADKAMVKKFREAGIITDVQPHLIKPNGFTGLVCCSDFRRRKDIFARLEHYLMEAAGHDKIHPLLLQGGALLIPEFSPLCTDLRKDLVYLDEIGFAYNELGMRTIALYVHTPCGTAASAGISFEDLIHLLLEAKLRIKTMFPSDLKVLCFCHVDKGDGTQEDLKRTYFVLPKKWREYYNITEIHSVASVL